VWEEKVVGKRGVGREVVMGRQEWDLVLWGGDWERVWGEKGGGEKGCGREESETHSCGMGGEERVRLSLVVGVGKWVWGEKGGGRNWSETYSYGGVGTSGFWAGKWVGCCTKVD
jgi:hypothetical protein